MLHMAYLEKKNKHIMVRYFIISVGFTQQQFFQKLFTT